MVAGLQGVKSKYTSLGDGSYIIKLIVGAVTGLCYWPIFVSASFSSVLTVYRIHKPWFFQSSVFCLILIATYGGPLYLRGPWGALSPIPENNAMTVDCQIITGSEDGVARIWGVLNLLYDQDIMILHSWEVHPNN
ncbi:uncharacterized protein [Primulina huaijiensis]|uniref:uncharacterized protein isoform X2 n=1 Tax=Primulina huaijiensis TaxID=1492673 RepID=UPI003CC71C4C